MNKIKVNVISRIAEDKNFFIDLLYAINYLKKEKNINVYINFVGEIYSYPIFNILDRYSTISEIDDLVSFEKKSIPIEEMNSYNEYYLNFSIGSFIGYSGVESIKKRLKTIFYNVDSNYKDKNDEITYLFDIQDFINLFIEISKNKIEIDKKIKNENLDLLKDLLIDKNTENSIIKLIDKK